MIKLELDDFDIQSFFLCAIHTSLSPIKLAFLINKRLDLRLHRCHNDIQLIDQNNLSKYLYFKYVDSINFTTYHLFQNKESTSKESLKSSFITDKLKVNSGRLVPDYQNVDYFLKIETEGDYHQYNNMHTQISMITKVSASYAINFHKIKFKSNLITE